MRKQIAAANWKMNLTLEEGIKLTADVLSGGIELQDHQEVVFGVPFPYLLTIRENIKNKANFFIAAQNCYFQKSGAYTGEVSAAMLRSTGTAYVIIGHSERREYFNENHQMLAEKINLCFENNLEPIFCCGEPISIREASEQNDYVETQLKESLFHLSPEQLTGFVIAYEPIWAIGTGKTASSAQAQEMHAHIRKVMANKYNDAIAESISILYGGSVKANNAKEIFSEKDVDGGLVGGASLVAPEFITIIQSLKSNS
ncbi:MAG TPA: triose-phosphate isomerase [Chitinophagaceae bacterium]|nr:triose-phosphate isomerase [Chitinophagaceae bacterium]